MKANDIKILLLISEKYRHSTMANQAGVESAYGWRDQFKQPLNMNCDKIIIIVVILFVIFGCQTEKQADVAKGEVVTVPVVDNIKEYLINSSLYLSSFVDKIDIIPLEFTDDCILSKIEKVVIYKDNIFVIEHFNSNGGKIYRFDMKGNFLNSIGNRGQGPQELLELMDFAINEDNNTIYLLDNAKQMIFCFDFNGKFIERIFINQYADALAYSDGLFYVFADNPSTGKNLFNLIIRNTKGEIVNMYFPSKKYLSSTNAKIFTKTKDGLLFTHPMDDIFYSLKGDSLYNFLFFDFGSYRFTLKEIEDINMMRRQTLDILMENERFAGADNFYHIGKWIYFNSTYKIVSHTFLYDINSGEIKVAAQIGDDLEYMFNNNFCGQTEDALIGVYIPETHLESDMEGFSIYEKEKIISRAKKEEQVKKMKSIMRGDKPEEMNPWILLYYLKQE